MATKMEHVNLPELADALGYETVAWDAENACWSGYGSSNPTDRTRDDAGGFYVAASDVELAEIMKRAN